MQNVSPLSTPTPPRMFPSALWPVYLELVVFWNSLQAYTKENITLHAIILSPSVTSQVISRWGVILEASVTRLRTSRYLSNTNKCITTASWPLSEVNSVVIFFPFSARLQLLPTDLPWTGCHDALPVQTRQTFDISQRRKLVYLSKPDTSLTFHTGQKWFTCSNQTNFRRFPPDKRGSWWCANEFSYISNIIMYTAPWYRHPWHTTWSNLGTFENF